MKKVFIYSLASIVSLAASGSAVYLTLRINDNINNSQIAQNDDYEEEVTPAEASNFSKSLTALMNAKEVNIPTLNLSLYSNGSNVPVNISLKNAKLDLSNSITSLNISTDINVTYSDINETFTVAYESNNKTAYISYLNKSVMLNVSSIDLNGIVKMIQTLGINIPSISTGDADLNSLLSKVLEITDNVVESDTLNGHGFTLDVPDIQIGSTAIRGISLFLESDKDNKITFIQIKDNGHNNGRISIGDKLDISLSLTMDIKDNSSYISKDPSSFDDLTSTSSSILTSIVKLLDEKKINAGVKLSLKDTSETGKLTSTVEGNIKADLSKTSMTDLTKGEYEISLRHYNDLEELNSINAHYLNSTTYLKLNNLFKGKIQNSTLDEMFSNISNILDDQKISEIEKQLNSILSKIDISSLNNENLNKIKDGIKQFNITDNKISLVLSAKLFSLGDFDITININTNDNKLTSIDIFNLKYQNYQFDFSLTLISTDNINFSSINENYKDYQAMAPIFNTVLDYVGKKKATVNYSLIYLNSKDESYVASGDISADLTGVNNFNTTDIINGLYHLSFNSQVRNNSQNIDLTYQNRNLYFNYNDVIKQSIIDSEIGNMKTFLDSKSLSDSVFTSINSLFSEIKNSKQYQDSITSLKSGSLKSLESFISIDKDNLNENQLVVELNVPYILKNTSLEDKIGSITLKLDNDDKSITSINVRSLVNKTSDISFTMNINDFDDSFVLNEEEQSKYIPITDVDKILSAFYSLPLINQKQFALKLSGKVLDNQNRDVVSISDDSAIAVDVSNKNKLNAYGKVLITHPSLDTMLSTSKVNFNKYVDQKIRFKYQTLDDNSSLDGQFTAEYNDKMHILLNSNTLLDVFNNIKKADSETNLLHRYLKVLSDVSTMTGSGLLDTINSKDISYLLDYPYIKKAEILDDRINLTIDGKLIDSSIQGYDQNITLSYQKGENPKFTSVNITGNTSSNKIEASISLVDFNEVDDPTIESETNSKPMLSYNDDSKSQFVDLNGFKMLSKCLIDTTESNYFNLTGLFQVKGKIFSINAANLTTAIDAKVSIFDEHAYAYLSFNNSPSLSNGKIASTKSINDKGFYCTEFFVSETSIEVCQTKNNNGTIKSEIFKIDDKNLLDDVVYFVLTYILDADNQLPMGSTIMASVYDSVSSTVTDDSASSIRLTNDFSNVISSETKYIDDENNPYFHLKLDANNIFDGSLSSINLKFGDTVIDIYHNKLIEDERTPFSKADITTNMDFLNGLISGSLNASLNADCKNISVDEASNNYMSRYYTFTTAFKEKYGGFSSFDSKDDTFTTNLPLYEISSYKIKKILGIPSYSLVDNSSTAKKYFTYSSASDADKVFFYSL